MGEGVFHERFSVEQYRAASFEVKVPPPAREPIVGEELKLTAEARLPVRRAAAWRGAHLARVPAIAARQLPEAAGVRIHGRAAVAKLDRLAVGRVGAAGRRERAAPGQEWPRQAVADAEEGGLPVGAGHHGHRRGTGRDAPDDRGERRDSRPSGRRLFRHRSRQPDRRGEGRAHRQARGGRPEGKSDRRERHVQGAAPRLDLRLGGVGLSGQLPVREEGRRGDAPGGQRVRAGAGGGQVHAARARASTSSSSRGRTPPATRRRRRPTFTRGATTRGRGRRTTTSASTSSPTSRATRSARPRGCC